MWMDVFLDPARPRETTTILFEQLRDAISSGRLGPGDRLPTSRWLADDLGVARSTVTTVYGRLVAEGVLEARTGTGTFVADHAPRGGRPRPSSRSTVQLRRPVAAGPAASGLDGIRIDLRAGRPDPGLFPLRAWRRAVRDAVELPPPSYGHAAGTPVLRAALATWVGRSRGLSATADDVLVTSGAQQAFDLCAQVLVSDGGLVAFEEPGYEPARRAFEHRGARIQPVPVDADGIVVEAIDPDVELVFVTPSHQSATGVTMSSDRRRELLEAAYDHDMVIVEDDYDTEYRYVARPLEPLHRRDTDGRVVYLGSFSKTLSPSLRIGFVIAPRHVIDALTRARAVLDVQPPHLTQTAIANLIVSGEFARHLRRTRPIYAQRHARVHEHLASLHHAGLSHHFRPTNAGLHAMVPLPPGADAAAIAGEMRLRGVLLHTTGADWLGSPEPGLVVGFGLATTEQLDEALAILADVVSTAIS